MAPRCSATLQTLRHLQRTALETVCTLVNRDRRQGQLHVGAQRAVGWLARLTGEALHLPRAACRPWNGPACCTTWARSACPSDCSTSPVRSPRRVRADERARSDRPTTCSDPWRNSSRCSRRCCTITRTTTARAIRPACGASRSRWRPASSTSSTSLTPSRPPGRTAPGLDSPGRGAAAGRGGRRDRPGTHQRLSGRAGTRTDHRPDGFRARLSTWPRPGSLRTGRGWPALGGFAVKAGH